MFDKYVFMLKSLEVSMKSEIIIHARIDDDDASIITIQTNWSTFFDS